MYRLSSSWKAALPFLILFLFASVDLLAQVPQGFNYQAVARNADGEPIADSTLDVTIALSTDPNMTFAQFEEVHTVTTNAFGLFSLVIGGGTPTIGSLQAVPWQTGQIYMNVQIGSSDLGTTQLQSVPYALYSTPTDDGDWDTTGNAVTTLSPVGIGTNNPGAGLDLTNDNDLASFLIRGAGDDFTYSAIEMANLENSSQYRITMTKSNDKPNYFVVDYTNGGPTNARFTIDTAGNVGIGQDYPVAKLDVAGATRTDTLRIGDNYTFPALDGIAGQVLVTDGAGNIAWQALTDSLQGFEVVDDSTLRIIEGNGSSYDVNISFLATDQELQDLGDDIQQSIDSISTQVATNQDSINILDDRIDSNAAEINTHIVNDLDTDTTNEIQDLSLSNDSILISNGDGVDLSDFAKDTQIDSLGGITDDLDARIDSSSNAIQAHVADDNDTSSVNELQDLSISNDSILISGGTGVDVSSFDNTAQIDSLGSIVDSNSNQIGVNRDSIGTLDSRMDSAAVALFLINSKAENNRDSIGILDSLIGDHVGNDADLDSTNEEITDSYISGDSLYIEEGGNVWAIDLSTLSQDTLPLIRSNDSSVVVSTITTDEVEITINDTLRYRFLKDRIDLNQASTYIGNAAGANDGFGYADSVANVGIGYRALNGNAGVWGAVAVGSEALENNSFGGAYNTAIGNQAMKNVDNGQDNVAIGARALKNGDNPNGNVAIGQDALGNQVSGNGNVAVGRGAGAGVVNAGGNVFLGTNAGGAETGSNKLYIDNSNTTAPLLYGDFTNDTLRVNGSFQVFNSGGDQLTYPTSDGIANDVIITDGAGNLSFVDPSTLVGTDTLPIIKVNDSNYVQSGIGSFTANFNNESSMTFQEGRILVEANTDLFIGSSATGTSDSIGYYNQSVAIGMQALSSNVSGAGNTAVGARTIGGVTGYYNTALGREAGVDWGGGNDNTFLGNNAGGQWFGSGSNNTFIGSNAGANSSSGTDISGAVKIGFNAGVADSNDNRLYIDNSSATSPLIWGDFANNIMQVGGTFRTNNLLGDTLTYPTTDGAAGDVLVTDGAGNLSFQAFGGDTNTLSEVLAAGSDATNDSIYNLGILSIGGFESTAALNVNSSGFQNTTLKSGNTSGTWLNLANTSTGGRYYQFISTGSTNAEGAGKLMLTVSDTSNAATSAALTIDSNAVGIGTTSPQSLLHVATADATNEIRLEGDANPGLTLKYSFYDQFTERAGIEYGQPHMTLYNTNPTGMIFFETDGATRMTVRQSGRVGIGTTSPSSLLDVEGRGEFDTLSVEGAYTLPTVDGAAGEVLTTDGAGNVSFAPLSADTNTLAEVLAKGNTAVSDTAYVGGLSVGNVPANTSLINATDNTRDISIEINNSTVSGTQTKGVFSNIIGIGTGDKYALYGEASANNGNKYGVYGAASGNGNTKYGLYGTASGTGTNWAGFFDAGNVNINDTLFLPAGAASGFVLTSDAAGKATWQLPSLDTDWNISGNYVYNLSDSIGVGTSAPLRELDVRGSGQMQGLFAVAAAPLSTEGGEISLRQAGDTNATLGGAWNLDVYSDSSLRIFNGGGPLNAIKVTTDQKVGIGYLFSALPDSTLSVNGGILADAIRLLDGAQNGYVLTSDATGSASWQAPPSDFDWDTTLLSNYQYIPDFDRSVYLGDTTTGIGIGGKLNVITSDSFGMTSIISGTSPGVQSMSGLFYNLDQNSTTDAYGIAAASQNTTGNRLGGWFIGRNGDYNTGVYALAETEAAQQSNVNVGVYTRAVQGDTNIAIWADAAGSATSDSTVGVFASATSPSGKVYSAVFDQGKALFKDSIQIQPGSNDGFVLTSDAIGNATWQAPQPDADWTLNGAGDTYFNLSDSIVVGDSVPSALFTIQTPNPASGFSGGLVSFGQGGDDARAIIGDAQNGAVQSRGVQGFAGGSPTNYAIFGELDANAGETSYGVYARANGTASTGTKYALYATAPDPNGTNYAAYFDQGKVSFNDSIVIPNGANAGYVLTSDVAGNATWQQPSNGLWDTVGNLLSPIDTAYNIGIKTTNSISDFQFGDDVHLFRYDDGTDRGLVLSHNVGQNLQYTQNGGSSIVTLLDNGIQLIAVDSQAGGTTIDLDNQANTSVSVKPSGVGINTDNAQAALEVQPVLDSIGIKVRGHLTSPGIIAFEDIQNTFITGVKAADTVKANYTITLPDTAPTNDQMLVHNATKGRLEWRSAGASSCPAGYSLVNGNFCIEVSARTGDNWFNAADTCASYDAKLPSWSEWYTGTQVTGVDWIGTNAWEWLDQASQNNASIAGGGSGANVTEERQTISADDPFSPSNTIQYRCVYRLKN